METDQSSTARALVTVLPTPDPGQRDAVAFVDLHLRHVVDGEVEASLRFQGGQSRADEALARFDVDGYAASRNEVYPQPARGASGLSPYIRHGLLGLRRVWDHVDAGPPKDVAKFRTELLWQEYARHWYARLGRRSRVGTRRSLPARSTARPTSVSLGSGATTTPLWDERMACIELPLGELHEDGWLVNQTRMWLASEWAVRRGGRWQDGEDEFFRHLLDGSRAANRLGWQWTTGVGSNSSSGFSRWQVEERAKSLCASCDLVHDCPIEDWPDDPVFAPIDVPVDLAGAPPSEERTGPIEPRVTETPDVVWLTAESLGADDPASVAHPDLPLVFVFDEPLLTSLRLSAKRLVFLTETLAEIGARRPLELHLGRPADVLAGRNVAVTFAPVPGYATRARAIEPVAVHPWPWLVPPGEGSVASFSAWQKATNRRR